MSTLQLTGHLAISLTLPRLFFYSHAPFTHWAARHRNIQTTFTE